MMASLERWAYREGIEAAASFLESGGWDAWVAGTLIRRLHGPRRQFATLPGIERKRIRL